VQTLLWAKWPTRSLDHFARRLPEPFTIRMVGNRKYVLASSPEAVKEIFTRFPDAGNEELKPFLGASSMFLLQGEAHSLHRQIIQPMLQGEGLRAHGRAIQEIVRRSVSALRPGSWVPVNRLTQDITILSILECIFGIPPGPRFDALKDLLRAMVNIISGPSVFFEFLQKDFGPLSPGGRISGILRKIDRLLLEEIRARENAMGRTGRKTLIDALLAGRNGVGMDEAARLDELKTILAAGYDPVSCAIAWALFWILGDQKVMERLLSEFRSPRFPGEPADIGMSGNTYLDAVCKETLRIVPIVPTVDRRVDAPIEFMGASLEPGTRLVACSYLSHRNAEIFPEPDRFRPERFVDARFSPFEYYPFGGGARRCAGAAFAMFEMKIILWSLLCGVRLRPKSKQKLRIVQRGVTLATPPGHKVFVEGLAPLSQARPQPENPARAQGCPWHR
jgi:cytochrome P450